MRRALALALSLLLLAPAAALAVTDDELRNLDTAGTRPAPHVGGGGAGSALRVLLGLVLVVVVIMAVHWVLKRTRAGRLPGTGGGPSGALDVLATTPLGPARHLHLVRVADHVLVVGATDHGINTLHRLERDEAVAHGLIEDERDGGFDHSALDPDLLHLLGGGSSRPSGGLLDALRDRTTR